MFVKTTSHGTQEKKNPRSGLRRPWRWPTRWGPWPWRRRHSGLRGPMIASSGPSASEGSGRRNRTCIASSKATVDWGENQVPGRSP